MPITTIVGCDECKTTKIEIGDGETPGAEEILQVTDANGVKLFFCGIECLRTWAKKYECPYKRPTPEPGELDTILPGAN
jgi:hypothetical protein